MVLNQYQFRFPVLISLLIFPLLRYHRRKNNQGMTSYTKGINPFPNFYKAKTYNPLEKCPYSTPYECVSDNINKWIEYAAKQVDR